MAGQKAEGVAVIGRPQQGGVVTRPQLIAKLRSSGRPQSIAALFLLSNRVLLIRRVVYLYRWRRGASLIQRLSGIDEGADGLWPLARLCIEEGEEMSTAAAQHETPQSRLDLCCLFYYCIC